MIQRVTDCVSNVSFKKHQRTLNPVNKSVSSSHKKDYVDSFISNTKESVAPMLVLTGVWSVLDNKLSDIPIKKAIARNFVGFFLPVIIVSSAILAGLENKK